MTHTYQVAGMTCSGCEASVKNGLLMLPEITSVVVSRESNSATITMDNHIPLSELQKAIGGTESKYQISITKHDEESEQIKNWFENYKPIILIFVYITLATFIVQLTQYHFDLSLIHI